MPIILIANVSGGLNIDRSDIIDSRKQVKVCQRPVPVTNKISSPQQRRKTVTQQYYSTRKGNRRCLLNPRPVHGHHCQILMTEVANKQRQLGTHLSQCRRHHAHIFLNDHEQSGDYYSTQKTEKASWSASSSSSFNSSSSPSPSSLEDFD